MKRVLLLLFFAILSLPVFAQAPADSLKLDKAGYEALLAKLEAQETAGIRNADLYYNLGVCHYQLGRGGPATLNFLRALNLNSAHRQARENLAYLNSLRPEGPQAPSRTFLPQLFLNIYDFFTLNRLAIIVLALAFLFTLSLHWLLRYPPDRERGLPVLVLILAGLFFLASASALLVKNHRFRHNGKAVIMSESLPLKASGPEGQVLRYLPEGSIVLIKQTDGDHSRVVLADGAAGWVANSGLERVVPVKKQ